MWFYPFSLTQDWDGSRHIPFVARTKPSPALFTSYVTLLQSAMHEHEY